MAVIHEELREGFEKFRLCIDDSMEVEAYLDLLVHNGFGYIVYIIQ